MSPRDVPAVLARGGSSRGLLIKSSDLVGLDEAGRERAFARLVGSPDPSRRQVDGVGGGNATTSKVVVVAPPTVADHHLDYEFYQVIVETGDSERRGTCGNLMTATAQFAVDEGLVEPTEPITTVRIHDVNTGQTVEVDVPVSEGAVVYTGDHTVDGVPGTGAPVAERFLHPAGRVTGSMLHTGELENEIVIDGIPLTVSLIDVVNAVVFVHASSLDRTTPWDVEGIDADSDLAQLLEQVRRWAAVEFGFASSVESAGSESPMRPFVGILYDRLMSRAPDSVRPEQDSDAAVRLMSGGVLHRAVPLSGGLATAALVRLRAERATGTVGGSAIVRIEHPTGHLDAQVTTRVIDGRPDVESVGVTLTGRRIMSGTVELE